MVNFPYIFHNLANINFFFAMCSNNTAEEKKVYFREFDNAYSHTENKSCSKMKGRVKKILVGS